MRPACRSLPCSCFTLLSQLDQLPVALAILAAMIPSILVCEPPFLGFGAEDLADLAPFLDDHIAALGHAEGVLE